MCSGEPLPFIAQKTSSWAQLRQEKCPALLCDAFPPNSLGGNAIHRQCQYALHPLPDLLSTGCKAENKPDVQDGLLLLCKALYSKGFPQIEGSVSTMQAGKELYRIFCWASQLGSCPSRGMPGSVTGICHSSLFLFSCLQRVQWSVLVWWPVCFWLVRFS